ncbi:helix-turn-helix domain-containing protein [Streptomyces sp. NPDC059456]|uniref:helix-turn-helix domain-containing protein n=1 Tax=Streptomyces sp. NPDC059456 TaxID=3346838 RepID=UPI003692B198
MTASVEEPKLPSPKERRRLREAADLTYEDVAAAVGVTVTTVRSWETGRTGPRGRKREAYALFLASLTTPPPPETAAPAPPPPETAAPAPVPAGTPVPAPPMTPPQGPGADGRGTESAGAAGAADAALPPADAGAPGPVGAAAADAGSSAGPDGRASRMQALYRPFGTDRRGQQPLPAVPTEPGFLPRHDAGFTARAAAGGIGVPGPGTSWSPVRLPDPAPPQPAPAAEESVPAPAGPERPPGPREVFDAMYDYAAPALTRQAYLLTGRRSLSQEAVEQAFQQAWARWPEVAVDPDPVGWVRAAVYEYALSPWHRFRRAHKHPEEAPAAPADRILMDAMLALPAAHRRTVLLYDGVGLDLPDTAAETEATTPTAGNRLLRAHAALADRIPELAAAPPGKESAVLRERLGAVTPAVRLEPRPAAVVRMAAEHRVTRWTRAFLGLTAVIAVATAYTTVTAPRQYEPPVAPGASVSGVPPLSGPQRLTEETRQLHDKLREHPAHKPDRLAPSLE